MAITNLGSEEMRQTHRRCQYFGWRLELQEFFSATWRENFHGDPRGSRDLNPEPGVGGEEVFRELECDVSGLLVVSRS